MNWQDVFQSPVLMAIACVCAIAVILAGVIGGVCARGSEQAIRRVDRKRATDGERATPMRTANSSVIEHQVRELQRRVQP